MQYFYPYVTRHQSELILKQTDYGCFLFRSNSENSPTLFLSYSSYLERENQTNGRKEIYHVMIHKHIKQYIIGISTTRVLLIDIDDTHIFHSLDDILKHYEQHLYAGIRLEKSIEECIQYPENIKFEKMQWVLATSNRSLRILYYSFLIGS